MKGEAWAKRGGAGSAGESCGKAGRGVVSVARGLGAARSSSARGGGEGAGGGQTAGGASVARRRGGGARGERRCIIGCSALTSKGVYASSSARKEYGSPPKLNSMVAPTRRSAEASVENGECFPAMVSVSNDADPRATRINVSVVDFPGLLRVVSWVLTGLELTVERAKLSTTDGMASQEFFVTDVRGRKVQDTRALGERIAQFVQHCAPDEEAMHAKKFREGRIVIDNEEDENFTVISIDSGEKDAPGLLLSIASTVSALGITIDSASICTECEHFSGGRYFRFLVHKIGGSKLDYVEASGALFTLSLVMESATVGSHPIHASRLH
ncbi:hypothetical protein HOP50_04g34370 [Chloropicon primus]|uniref:ACT domain-containing protein n=1 Tax=Chloropicon primus TaxID=1764295 RepID=A0A5B8MKD5_9CHLO|nr:hypothetical protein A3770_04p34310 [Chloropicon primus]UPR00123.1 hypothetical protein HOP50_04g34370 [Chloropicon primus]|eukprot:QDZ20913.1 hypothetical protein A3770_04p34310 [Chloropicon primus]